MPFEQYLRDDENLVRNYNDYANYYQDHRHACDDSDCHNAHGQLSYLPEITDHDRHNSHPVHFQIPQFMLNGSPVLAPGGGAEVLPAGFLDSDSDSLGSSWFANHGFAPLHSTVISRHITSSSTPPDVENTTSFRASSRDGSQQFPPNLLPRFTASVDQRQQSLRESQQPPRVVSSYTSDIAPSPPGTSNTTSYSLSNALLPDSVSCVPVTDPSALGLPVYSASGFDILSILSRVANRSNPTIQLGPVDLSCSFVIVDVRRHDSPIVYASPTFCHLTGYSEQEVLGRNCRFLQSPTGRVAKGQPRHFTSPDRVSQMRKLLSSSKECQTSLINYRKDGQAFINLVTVIPIRGGVHNAPEEADEVVYHVGFQVDLTEQPTWILDKLRDGSYYSVDNSSWRTGNLSSNCVLPAPSHCLGQLVQARNTTDIGPKGGRHGQMMSIAVSKELKNLIADPTFTDSVLISTGTNMSGPTGISGGLVEQSGNATTPLTMLVTPPSNSTPMNRMSACGNTMAGSVPISLSPSLSLLLLEFLPDFLLVLSLKGAFLYVAPSVRQVLGYEPQELVGRNISDVCLPADLVPLMRELKEGSVSGLSLSGPGDIGSPMGTTPGVPPKSVDLLFRALPKVSTTSPSQEVEDTFAVQDCFHPSQPSTASASQSPPSSGPSRLNDSSDQKRPPYIWLECRGRLHVEPGKGRKAIILSGRARWMPVVHWSTINKANGIGNGGSPMMAGSKRIENGAASINPLEFWALLSIQGTLLVTSAGVRDVLGWGTSEMIGRNIWSMVRDKRTGMKEYVEAELAKLDTLEVKNPDDPPPTIVTTALVHRESHVVPMRLIFYRTPRSVNHMPPSTSPHGVTSTPLIHPLNNPLCPVVCQATVLSDVEDQLNNTATPGLSPDFDHVSRQAQKQTDLRLRGEPDRPDPCTDSSSTSLFEELECARGTSWQYELQQLKYANQRLHEEIRALEGMSGVVDTGSISNGIGAGRIAAVPLGQPCGSFPSTTEISIPRQSQLPQTQLHYTPLIHSTRSTSIPSLRLPNSLHEQDPPSSGWSSLAGANGQGPNPLKRSWHSEDGPTT